MQLTYIFHSGFALETDRCILVFDYWMDPAGVMPRLLQSPKPLYVFSSHFHEDHFNRDIFSWQTRKANVRYILSKDILKHRRAQKEEADAWLGKGATWEDELLRATATGSNDSGVSWVIETDGKRIFHAGDLNNWYARFLTDDYHGGLVYSPDFGIDIDPAKEEKRFLGELKDIRKLTDCFDVVMFPVDGRIGNGYIAIALLLLGMALPALRPQPAYGPAGTNRLHEAASERIRRLHLPPDTEAVALAMAAGDQTELTPERRAPYARTGTAHVLAVSGLHVGMVFLYVNLLLGALALLHRGHLLRNAAAIAVIWLFAAAAGLSPGTIRAAVMFTALQLALATTSRYAGVNILSAAAFGMLLWRPSYLFHVGFQLSFLSVAAILLWGIPLYRRLRTPWRAANAAVGMLVVGAVASTATAPLVYYCFAQIPLVGLAVNPPVILLTYGVVGVSLLWLAIPWPPLSVVVRPLLEGLLWLQNRLVAEAAALPCAAIDYRMTAAQTAVVYLFFVIFTLVAYRPWRKNR